MNIWIIQTGEILPIESSGRKMRCALLADKLVERGHNVLWWTSAFDHYKKDWIVKKDTEIVINERYKIFALKGLGYKKNISLSRFIDHRIVAWKFKKFAPKMPKPDIIVASMPSHDLAYEAVMFAKKNDIPVLVDIRDEWPDIFLDYIPKSLHKLAKITLSKDFQMSKRTMQRADGLISMMNSLLEWGLNYAQREKSSKDRVFYLGANRTVFSQDVNSPKIQNLLSSLKNKFVVTFIGVFNNECNPSILVDCAIKLLNIKDIIFVLGGDGDFFNQVKQKASLISNVILPGWLNNDEISMVLKHANIGVIPANRYRNALPNKTFTYLSAGLPIISAFQGDLKEIIEKYQMGFYYPPNDVDALVDCIMKLYSNPELYKKMSENAKRVFDEMFDTDKIYNEYASHIENVAINYKNLKRG